MLDLYGGYGRGARPPLPAQAGGKWSIWPTYSPRAARSAMSFQVADYEISPHMACPSVNRVRPGREQP